MTETQVIQKNGWVFKKQVRIFMEMSGKTKQEDWMTRFLENSIEDRGKGAKNILADTAQLFQREAEDIEKKSGNFWVLLESCRLLE